MIRMFFVMSIYHLSFVVTIEGSLTWSMVDLHEFQCLTCEQLNLDFKF